MSVFYHFTHFLLKISLYYCYYYCFSYFIEFSYLTITAMASIDYVTEGSMTDLENSGDSEDNEK